MDPMNEIKDLVEQGNESFEAKTGELAERLSAIETTLGRPGAPMMDAKQSNPHADAFTAWLRAPKDTHTKASLSEVERKTASGLTDSAGGFIVPEIIAGPLNTRARDANTLRPVVRSIQVASGDVVLPLSNADAGSGWVGETDVRNGTTEPSIDGPRPTFGTLFALVESSEELAMDSVFDVQDWFIREAGAALGEAEATAIVSGNGVKKPTGMLHVAPEDGADGTRTAGAFKYLAGGDATELGTDSSAVQDLLVNMVHDLKASYRANGAWAMNSATAGAVRKLKDGDGECFGAMAWAHANLPACWGIRWLSSKPCRPSRLTVTLSHSGTSSALTSSQTVARCASPSMTT